MKILAFKLTNINIDFAKIFLFNCKIDFIELSKFKIVFYDQTNGHAILFMHLLYRQINFNISNMICL